MSRLLDPKFKYTPSHLTDISKTIAREKRRLAGVARRKQRTEEETARVVTPIKRSKP